MVAAVAAVFTACAGNARRNASADRLQVTIGTFLSNASQQRPVSNLVGILSAEPLVSVAWDGRPILRLAESVTPSANGLQLTVSLRPNLKFHSGAPVTAGTVADLLRPKLPFRAKEIASITVTDPRTLVFELKRAHAYKIEDLSGLIVDDDKRIELRTGPFKVVSMQPTAVLESFHDYSQGEPAVARVEIREYPSNRAAWTAMMRNEVNFLHEINRDAIDFIEAGGDIRAYPLLRPYYVPLVFNQKHPVLHRRDVRIALNEAIDRDEIVKNGMRGHGQVAEGPFWPHHWAYPQGRTPALYNPDAAKLRLDAAGFPVRDHGFEQMPSRFEFTCLLNEGDARFERIALLVQRQLSAIGVDMKLRPIPPDQLQARLGSGDFDAFLFEIVSGRTLGYAYSFWHSPAPGEVSFVKSGYAAADEALDRLKLAQTDDDTRVALADVMRVLRADPPAAFLVWPRDARAASRSIDIPYEPDRDVFGTFSQLRPAPPLRAEAR